MTPTLIKRGSCGAAVGGRPRILDFDVLARRHVHRHCGEAAHVEKVRVRVLGGDVEVDHRLESTVGVEPHPAVCPFHRIHVEVARIVSSFRVHPAVEALEKVGGDTVRA